jgi:hypothetical protein
MNPSAVRWWQAIVAVGFLNFGAFLASALILGGDAVNGYQKDDRYYVAEKGKITEVRRGVWLYSRAHAYSVWVTHPLAIVGLLILSRARLLRR